MTDQLPRRACIICTSPRSGSTLLCKLLEATGVAGQPKSYFHVPSLDRWVTYFGLCAEDFETERGRLEAVFNAARKAGTSTNGVFGLRLQRHSFNFFSSQLKLLHPDLRDERQRFETAFGKPFFLHLSREDKLAQAVSVVKATQTGLWHRAADGSELERTSAHKEPVYDAEEIKRQTNLFHSYDKEWEQWFKDARVEPLKVTYDQLSSNPGAVLARTLGWLGLDPEAAKGVSPPVARLADETNQVWIERFRSEEWAFLSTFNGVGSTPCD